MNDMLDDREARVRHCAYMLWLAEGQPEGRADQHWRAATGMVDAESAKNIETIRGTVEAAELEEVADAPSS